jgi:hypothetical protein
MPEQKSTGVKVKWITARVEETNTAGQMERVFFEGSDNETYYLELRAENRATELVAISLIRDAFIHGKKLNLFWERRNERRWLKAVNIWG